MWGENSNITLAWPIVYFYGLSIFISQGTQDCIQKELAAIKSCLSKQEVSLVSTTASLNIHMSIAYDLHCEYCWLQAERKDCLVQLIYCHMLGYDVSFGYIHALKLAQQGSAGEKQTGEFSIHCMTSADGGAEDNTPSSLW